MKKVSLLIALIAFVFGNAFAQTVLSYDFNDGVAGAKIAQTYGMPWTTWSNAPGGSEDGTFGEAGGTMAAHFTYNNDQVLYLGDHSTGVYDLEFDAYVPNGKNGYFNVLHHFAGSNSTWAIQVYMHETNDGQNSTAAPGHGTVHAGSNGTADLPCVYDAWMHCRVHVDADNDVAQLYFNVVGEPEVMYAEWQWSLDSFGENVTDRVLGAMDFFPPENAATSEYYIDNLTVTLQSNDEVLIYDTFEDYTVGNKIAVEAQAAGNDWWTTWSNAPGGSEDGVVAENGTKCGYLTYGTDQVILLGDADNGNYDLEFDILVPNGKNGYFNVLHHFAGSNSTWAMQCYLHLTNDGSSSTAAPGHGTIHAGSNGTADVACVYDAWMHFRLNIDTDTDVANYYYTAPGGEEELVCTWQWSLDSFGNNVVGRVLAAMDFFPPQNAANSEFYVDNFKLTKIGGESAPHLSVDPESVSVALAEDDMEAVEITITNTGNSIGDWSAYLDFGQGGTGSQTAALAYHDGTEGNNIGSDAAYTREMGVRFPATAYGNTAMGMKAVSAQYFIGTNYQSADHNYIFRLYGQGLHGQPGELLAEKTVTSTAVGQWITATFDEAVYMTGQDVWATVQLEQNAGEYPLTMDDGSYGEEQDGNWLSTSGNTFSHCYSSGSFEGAWLITLNCQGEKIPGGWASLNKSEGAILGGQEETVVLSMNSIAMELGTYNATLVINTNDAELPVVEIPVTLYVTPESVGENAENTFSVYPNPTTGIVNVEGENIAAIAIYSAAGQLINVVTTTTVDMSVYGAGVYFLNILDNANNSTVTRVVVK